MQVALSIGEGLRDRKVVRLIHNLFLRGRARIRPSRSHRPILPAEGVGLGCA